jgi:hypothetical protein
MHSRVDPGTREKAIISTRISHSAMCYTIIIYIPVILGMFRAQFRGTTPVLTVPLFPFIAVATENQKTSDEPSRPREIFTDSL